MSKCPSALVTTAANVNPVQRRGGASTHALSVGSRVSLWVEDWCGPQLPKERLSSRDNIESQLN